MRRNLSQYLTVLAATASIAVTSSVNGDTPYDPDGYYCAEESKNAELGMLQAYVYAHKRSDYRSFEGEWRTD